MQGRQKQCPRCHTVTDINSIICVQCGRQFKTSAPPPPDEQTTFFQATPQAPAPTYQPAPPQAPAQQLDLYALLALVTLIIGFFMLTIVFGVASIILAVISLHRQNHQAHLAGKGMAITALLLGVVWAMWGAIQIGWVVKDRMMSPVAQ
jgi:hypothetical protein